MAMLPPADTRPEPPPAPDVPADTPGRSAAPPAPESPVAVAAPVTAGEAGGPPGGWRGWLFDLHLAAAFLLRVPLPPLSVVPVGALARAMRLFPLIGMLVGGVGAALHGAATAAGLDATLAGLLAVLGMVLVTGALHEDGLADTADGFGAGGDSARKLTIMRDSRIGSFGGLALVFSVGLRAAAIGAIGTTGTGDPWRVVWALVLAGALSRAAMPFAMHLARPARRDGLAVSAGPADDDEAFAATVIALATGVVLAFALFRPGPAVIALLAAAAAVVVVTLLARRHIGGYTGDTLGATGQSAEIATLLALAASLAPPVV